MSCFFQVKDVMKEFALLALKHKLKNAECPVHVMSCMNFGAMGEVHSL